MLTLCVLLLCSMKHSNCYMVWAGESSSPGQGRNNNGLEIGCLVDTTIGLLTFTANGKELTTYYQVNSFSTVAVSLIYLLWSFLDFVHPTICISFNLLPPCLLFLFVFMYFICSQPQILTL